MVETLKDIHDIDNPDRGLCSIVGCLNLRRNHGHKIWGKFCDRHHKEPVTRAERKAIRKLHREMVKAEKAARAIEYRRNVKLATQYPKLCRICDARKAKEEFPPQHGRLCTECHKENERDKYLRKYGIDLGIYRAMLLGQNGVCSICGGLPAGDKSLAVDHCHETGLVRGLLCEKCNTGLGLFKDDLDLLASASSYLINSRLEVAV